MKLELLQPPCNHEETGEADGVKAEKRTEVTILHDLIELLIKLTMKTDLP